MTTAYLDPTGITNDFWSQDSYTLINKLTRNPTTPSLATHADADMTSDSGDEQIWTMSALGVTGTVTGIKIYLYAEQVDADQDVDVTCNLYAAGVSRASGMSSIGSANWYNPVSATSLSLDIATQMATLTLGCNPTGASKGDLYLYSAYAEITYTAGGGGGTGGIGNVGGSLGTNGNAANTAIMNGLSGNSGGFHNNPLGERRAA